MLFVCSMLCFLQHVQQPSLASIGNAAVDCQDDKLVDNNVTSNCVLQTITMTAIELWQLYRHELLLCAMPSPCLKCVSLQCNDDTQRFISYTQLNKHNRHSQVQAVRQVNSATVNSATSV